MPLRLTNLELPVEESEEQLRDIIIAKLGLGVGEPITWRILRKSLDERSRDSLRFVYTVVAAWPGETEWQAKNSGGLGIERFVPAKFEEPPLGNLPLSERPIVVGSGPAGRLAAYQLGARRNAALHREPDW